MATFVVVALQSSEFSIVKDGGVRGGGMLATEIDLSAAFVWKIAKDWNVHGIRVLIGRKRDESLERAECNLSLSLDAYALRPRARTHVR